jgi:AraC family transcriptional regulator
MTLATQKLLVWQAVKVAAHIDANLARAPSVAELARVLGYSVSHFARVFTTTHGVPPARFVVRRRIERGSRLLRETALPVSAVALACGFADQGHFCRQFRSVLAATPARWRRQQRSST